MPLEADVEEGRRRGGRLGARESPAEHLARGGPAAMEAAWAACGRVVGSAVRGDGGSAER